MWLPPWRWTSFMLHVNTFKALSWCVLIRECDLWSPVAVCKLITLQMAWPDFTSDVSSYSEKCYEYGARCKTSASVALLSAASSPTALFITLQFESTATFSARNGTESPLAQCRSRLRDRQLSLQPNHIHETSLQTFPWDFCQIAITMTANQTKDPGGFCPLREMFVSSSMFVLSSNTMKPHSLFDLFEDLQLLNIC